MTQLLFANNAIGTLAIACSSTATTLQLTSGQGANFPAPSAGQAFYAVLQNGSVWESVLCTGNSSDILTVTRAQEGTTAQAFASNTVIEMRFTAAVLNAFIQAYSANYASPTGNAANQFAVANAVASASAVPLSQLNSLLSSYVTAATLAGYGYTTSAAVSALLASYATSASVSSSISSALSSYVSMTALTTALASYAALAGSATQPFSVGPATAATQAPQAQQVLAGNGAGPNVITGSRSIGTTFTNSAQRAIFVQATLFASSSTWSMSMQVNGVTVSQLQAGNGNFSQTLSAIVPAGATYKVTTSGSVSLTLWVET